MKPLAILFILTSTMLTIACSSSKKSASAGAGATSGKSASYNHKKLDNNTFKLDAVSDDSTYGYTQKNPILVGGALKQEGPSNERRFLNALLGPNGETIKYHREGSCCPFDTKNGFMGGGMLDIYEVTWEGLAKPIIIYINMYDGDALKAPKGFTFR